MQRGLRQKLLDTYPGFEPFIEEFMPKKASLEAVKLYSPTSYSHFPVFANGITFTNMPLLFMEAHNSSC